jgi:hypothetical protein
MKLLTLKLSAFAFLFLTVATSCNKVKDLISINVSAQSADVDFTIQPAGAGTGVLSQFNTSLYIDSLIKEQAGKSYGLINIKSVKLESCVLTTSNSDDANSFGNVSACSAEMSSNVNTTMVGIAALTNNPATVASTLNLPVNTTLDLKPYFGATSFSYKLSGTLVKPITKALTCKATLKYKIEVGL